MFENFKALSQLKEQLEALNMSAQQANETMAALRADIDKLKAQTQESIDAKNLAREEQQKFIQTAKKEMDEIVTIRYQLSREVQSFDNVKRELAANVAKRMEAELKDLLSEATAELKTKSLDVKTARETLDSLSVVAVKAQESLNRLHFIASDIKTKDFDLSKALQVIKSSEQEKIDLQQRLDKAESYAAKEVKRMREQRRPMMPR